METSLQYPVPIGEPFSGFACFYKRIWKGSFYFFLLLVFISSYDLAKTFISDRKDV